MSEIPEPAGRGLVFAVDLGGTHLRIGLVDDTGKIHKQLKRQTPKDESPAHAQIVYPAAGQVIAVDPDIPEEAQRVHFQATGFASNAQRQLQWRLNGEPLVSGQADAFWRPRPGRFLLSLHDAGGNELDRVEFEVRGSPTSAQR